MPGPARLLVSALSLLAACGGSRDTVAWHPDLSAAQRAARREGRLLLVQVAAPGLPLGDEMQARTYADADVRRLIAELACVRLEPHTTAATALCERVLGARSALATYVVDADLQPVAALSGFVGADACAGLLRAALAARVELRRLRQHLAAAPSDGAARWALAQRLLELGCVAAAGMEFERLAAADDWCGPRACERLARLAIDGGDVLSARRWLARQRERAAATEPEQRALAPDDRDALHARLALTEALVLSCERATRAATQALEAALARWPRAGERDRMLLEVGRLRRLDGDRALAADAFAELLHAHPRSPLCAAARAGIEALLRGDGGPHGHDHSSAAAPPVGLHEVPR